MLVLGIDPGIANCGVAVVDSRTLTAIYADVICPASRRKVEIGKTRTGKRKKTVVPGSLSSAENDAWRSGVIFERLVDIVKTHEIGSIAVEERTINAVWAMSTKMTQQAVLTAVECCAVVTQRERDFLAVKDVHAVLGLKIPRGVDPKEFVKAAVIHRGDMSLIEQITPPSRRVHAYDAAAVAIAAIEWETSKTAMLARGA